jgi:hypothetical protein
MPYDSPMTALRNRLRRDRLLIVETTTVDNPGGVKAIGQFQFNPDYYGQVAAYRLQAVISTSKGSITGSVQLYNVTDGEAVTNGLVQTSSIAPDAVLGSPLIMGSAAGNLKDTIKTYEVRISVTGTDATDILTVGSVTLLVF